MTQRPTHPKAHYFLAKKLFSNLKSFGELEARIENLIAEQEKGAAFEVFAEAYFATQKLHQAKQIWADRSAPPDLLKRAGLTRSDQGSDGLLETVTGEIVSYQVKFRTKRHHLTWTEISTFLGQTDKVDHRILFSNSTSIANVAKSRSNFSKIGGNVLDDLTASDFARIEAWLAGSKPIQNTRLIPKPHQQEAIQKLTQELSQASRATTVMACGTGKTLTSLWLTETLGLQNIIVLVPSLALLRQLLKDWMAQTSWENISYLCVCSDETVDKNSDEISLRASDLEFKVTTEPSEVSQFLKAKIPGVRLLLTTYHSAPVVGKAAKLSDFKFDFGIFDEAHKTAGKEGRQFSYALDDEKIFIKKRLFLTATPRHFEVLKRDKDGDPVSIYSMDNPSLYGQVAYSLPFVKAAQQGIICPLKIIISIITSGDVTKELIKRGTTKIKDTLVDSQQVANQLAVSSAVSKYGIKKIFTFHRTVASAASFVSEGPEGVGIHLSGFKTYFVSGSMPTDERERELKRFKSDEKALIANAKCLTEGVDAPSVDLVAFLSPRRSTIDIVQAAGRAMRANRESNKQFGYVLIPIFLEQEENEEFEKALESTKYDYIWTILQALGEQDESLTDVIREMRENKGHVRGYSDRNFSDKLEILGSSILIDSLKAAIQSQCVLHLSSTWDERFGEIKAFKEKYGHCNVPQGYKENLVLSRWVNTQRTNQSKLSILRKKRLDSIGFDWNPMKILWENKIKDLLQFKEENGHCNVPVNYPTNPSLSVWVDGLRERKSTLTSDEIMTLDKIGFDWLSRHDRLWEDMFACLREYKKKYGHSNVPRTYKEILGLNSWVNAQRTHYSKKTLSQDRISKLESLDFDWDPHGNAWDEMFAELVKFFENHGHCKIRAKHPESPKLGRWVDKQRQKQNQLSPERIERLNRIGFVWSILESFNEEMFKALVSFHESTGHCNVPAVYPPNRELGRWVRNQRKRRSELAPEEVIRLEELNFDWDPHGNKWDKMYAELVKFKETHGHCNVSQNEREKYPKLRSWILNQRTTRSSMPKDRIELLDRLGFVWVAKRGPSKG